MKKIGLCIFSALSIASIIGAGYASWFLSNGISSSEGNILTPEINDVVISEYGKVNALKDDNDKLIFDGDNADLSVRYHLKVTQTGEQDPYDISFYDNVVSDHHPNLKVTVEAYSKGINPVKQESGAPIFNYIKLPNIPVIKYQEWLDRKHSTLGYPVDINFSWADQFNGKNPAQYYRENSELTESQKLTEVKNMIEVLNSVTYKVNFSVGSFTDSLETGKITIPKIAGSTLKVGTLTTEGVLRPGDHEIVLTTISTKQLINNSISIFEDGTNNKTLMVKDKDDSSGKTYRGKFNFKAGKTYTFNYSLNDSITNIEITNKALLQNDFTIGDPNRVIEVKIIPSTFVLDTALENGDVTIISSDPQIIEVRGKELVALKKGFATITVNSGSIKDQVTINVIDKIQIGNPTLELDTTKLYVMQNQELELPIAKATSTTGQDLTNEIVIKDNQISTITSNRFSSSEIGEHTLIYQVKDPLDSSKITTKQLKIEVCRKLFAEGGTPACEIKELTEKENQTYKVTDKGQGIKVFNLKPSKLYYAEAIIDMPEANTSYLHGMAHFDQYTDPNYHWMIDAVRNRDDITHMYVDSYGWAIEKDRWIDNIDKNRDLSITRNDQTIKYAIARDGNTTFTFINDKLVTTSMDNAFFDKDTVPGFFTNGDDNETFVMNAKNINFVDGADAKNKINSLFGEGKKSFLQPCKNYEPNENQYLYQPFETPEKGLGYNLPTPTESSKPDGSCNCYNSAKTMVKIETLFTGSWKVAWNWNTEEVKPCSHKQEAHHNVEFRRWNYQGEIARLGLEKQGSFDSLKTWAGYNWGKEVVTDGFDFSLGYHFELERKCLPDKDIYTWIISSVKNPEQKITNSFEYAELDHGEAGYIIFHNDSLSGELSHLTFDNIKLNDIN